MTWCSQAKLKPNKPKILHSGNCRENSPSWKCSQTWLFLLALRQVVRRWIWVARCCVPILGSTDARFARLRSTLHRPHHPGHCRPGSALCCQMTRHHWSGFCGDRRKSRISNAPSSAKFSWVKSEQFFGDKSFQNEELWSDLNVPLYGLKKIQCAECQDCLRLRLITKTTKLTSKSWPSWTKSSIPRTGWSSEQSPVRNERHFFIDWRDVSWRRRWRLLLGIQGGHYLIHERRPQIQVQIKRDVWHLEAVQIIVGDVVVVTGWWPAVEIAAVTADISQGSTAKQQARLDYSQGVTLAFSSQNTRRRIEIADTECNHGECTETSRKGRNPSGKRHCVQWITKLHIFGFHVICFENNSASLKCAEHKALKEALQFQNENTWTDFPRAHGGT